MRTRRHLLMLVAIAAVAVAACGSSGGSKSGGSTSSSTKATTSTSTRACPDTEWADTTAAWQTLASGPYAEGRRQVAEDLAALRRGQDTSEVGQVTVAEVGTGEPLVVVLSETGV